MSKESETFDSQRFEQAWQVSHERAQRVLERDKSTHKPNQVAHTYDDKYRLAERLTTSALQGLLQTLEPWGWNEGARAQCLQWAHHERASVVLEFHATETCVSRGTRKRKEAGTETVTSVTTPRGLIASLSQRWTTRSLDYVWKYALDYEVVAVRRGGQAPVASEGPTPPTSLSLFRQQIAGEVLTSVDSAPCPKKRERAPLRVDITWLLLQMEEPARVRPYEIQRAHAHCYTPRRNPEMERALAFAHEWTTWASRVSAFFLQEVYRYGQEERVDMASVQAHDIFVPVLALFHSREDGAPDALLSDADQERMLGEQGRTLQDKMAQLQKSFPVTKGELIGYPEVQRVVQLLHSVALFHALQDGVQFLEEMLRQQLVEAIGKSVQPADMAQYMDYHYRHMFTPPYRPQELCYAVQRHAHHPEGVVSVEAYQGAELRPLTVFTHAVPRPQTVRVALDATTQVALESQLFVHTWIQQRFSAAPQEAHRTELQLMARSGPFSHYLLIVGTLTAPDQLDPQAAILLQSRDLEVCIPLLAEDIPSAQAFRQASESLSPEQLAFVSAYRRMQLEGTLLGVAVVQIKPQLEKVLGLPPDALTKHVALVEDLLELFVRYHIPSDLVSYDQSAHAPPLVQVQRVEFLVQEMKDMVAALRAEELAQAKKEAERQRDLEGIPQLSSPYILSSASPQRMTKSKSKSKGKRVKDKKAMPKRRNSSVVQGHKKMDMREKEKKKEARPSSPARRRQKKEEVASPPPADDAPVGEEHEGQPLPHEFIDQAEACVGYDATVIPGQLDEALDLLDPEGALRAATLRALTKDWKRTFRASLLSEPTQETLDSEGVRGHKNQAFDLLDALTRAGLLPWEHCQVHVLMATSHLFDRSVMDTLICRNVNPIDRMSRSAYIIASVLHGHPAPEDLLLPSSHAALLASSPQLFSSPPLPPSHDDDAHDDEQKNEEEEEEDKEDDKEEEKEEEKDKEKNESGPSTPLRGSRDSRVSNAEVVSKIEAKLARLAQSGDS